MIDFPASVPTWSPSKQWHYTEFATREDFRLFIVSLFIGWGPDDNDDWYKFDEATHIFNSESRKFNAHGFYIDAPRGSKDYRTYWRTMKERCRKGVIFHNDKGNTWYLPRAYYHWLNFLKIGNKAKGDQQTFPDILDAQYHMSLYELMAELHYKHAIIFKKRQFAFSYYHAAVLYNRYIHDKGFIGKMGASIKDKIDDTGTWKFLAEYRDFTLEHTGWYRPNFPEKPMNWMQQQEIRTSDGKKLFKGTKSKLTGHTFDKSPTAGVGGRTSIFYYEEAGIAPTLAKTYGYMKPAMEYGMITTGLFIAGGSVGELTSAQDLYKYLMNPVVNGFFPVTTNLLDKNKKVGETGLVIPEQWAMATLENDCIDQYGNSIPSRALQRLDEKFELMKKTMDAGDYQLEVSQHPRNIEEGFSIRTVSIFPAKYTVKQVKRIEDKQYNMSYVDLERTDTNEIVEKKSEREPMVYPTEKSMEDKRGCIVIVEKPVPNAPWGTYLGSIDPVETGDTKTSESLASIYIYKRPIEVTRISGTESQSFVEGDIIVAWWTGRYSDPNETNENMSKLVEYYNAKVTCEKNKPGFISYMQLKKRQKYLAHIDDMIFDKEYEVRDNMYQAYGWYNTPQLWKKILEYGIDSLSEEKHPIFKSDGTVDRIVYGVERIPDIWLLKEMQQYEEGKNADRIIAYCALMAFAKRQEIIMGIRKRTERKDSELTDKQKINRNLVGKQMFHNIGNPTNRNTGGRSRSVFKNIR